MSARFNIDPPLLNSASPWATTLDDLLALYASRHTGAVTTRTCMIDGFAHDDNIHKFAFFNPISQLADIQTTKIKPESTSSLNNLGYSPLDIDAYLDFIKIISVMTQDAASALRKDKLIIVSVTGTPEEVLQCFRKIEAHQTAVVMPLAMEINLSCPNIPNKPPPAYSSDSLHSYLTLLPSSPSLPVGLKLPPYTYDEQFSSLVGGLARFDPCPIAFLTSTNTLGHSMLFSPTSGTDDSTALHYRPTLSPAGRVSDGSPSELGGLAGTALHPLALGNVYSLKKHLDRHAALSNIVIVGVGGVEDVEGFRRMREVGASAVGLATALGRKGMTVFEEIQSHI